MSERIVVANVWGGSNKQGSRLVAWLKGVRFTVALISELGGMADDLRAAGRVYFNAGDTPRDVGVVVARPVMERARKRISWTGRRLTRFVKRKKKPLLWRDRWFVRVRIWNRVYYSIHANAAIQGPKGQWLTNDGAKEWRDALKTLFVIIERDIKNGRRVRVGGDFNFKNAPKVAWSPEDFFGRLGLKWFSDGRVMYVAWDPRRDHLVWKKEMPIAPGADAHGTLLIELKRKNRKERKKDADAAA